MTHSLFTSWGLAVLLLHPVPAQASCKTVVRAIQRKVAHFKKYRERQEADLAELAAAAQNCEQRGSTLARKSAAGSAGLTCTAQLEAREVNTQMKDLGDQCEKRFEQIRQKQGELFETFTRSKVDIDVAAQFAAKSTFLKRDCAEELKAVAKLREEFGKLRGQIVSVEIRSIAGRRDYKKFRDTAGRLGRALAPAAQNCEGMTGTPSPKLQTGQEKTLPPPLAPSKPNPNSSSDITGTEPSNP